MRYAQNEFQKNSIEVPDQGKYRQTPEGQPTVGELIKVNDWIMADYHDRASLVISVTEYNHCLCRDRHYNEHQSNCETFKMFSIGIVDQMTLEEKKGKYRSSDIGSINELVAVDNVIRKLFVANKDMVKIVKRPKNLHYEPGEEDETDNRNQN